ncbi:FGGY-family carbohydrate kinase [Methylonatrum kenyense]|uniref:FGGY-family carbohydrate kinase n=1 Tax=Methylonatrum kenyense TaxID=455253 RepID=UPI0020C1029F|nr:FGGY-family carbohydrate kinase [Methylonatrum kenyense]MCK8516893.1 FGGY-family carbohydrate kinase [Methylonatrum kenyense]
MDDAALYAGIDVGTSGIRLWLGDRAGFCVERHGEAWPAGRMPADPAVWWEALRRLLSSLAPRNRRRLAALAIDGTSGTVLLATPEARAVSPAQAYDMPAPAQFLRRIEADAPEVTAARGSGSGLGRGLALLEGLAEPSSVRLATQADWLAACLLGRLAATDENNALKLGYDPVERCWPRWILSCGLPSACLLPAVPPGAPLGGVTATVAAELGIPPDCLVAAGTTDSIAGFLATGAGQVGDAVTSLGTTLAVKLVSPRPVFSPEHGVYSHRLGRHYLVGGASNTGGGVLAGYFSRSEVDHLSQQLDPGRPTELDYYPLRRPGERFPWNAPELQPRLEPRPTDPVRFLQGMLEAMARIEADAYHRLVQLGAPQPASVLTVGGGARNEAWRQIRQRILGIPVHNLATVEPAYGAARLAMQADKKRPASADGPQ